MGRKKKDEKEQYRTAFELLKHRESSGMGMDEDALWRKEFNMLMCYFDITEERAKRVANIRLRREE